MKKFLIANNNRQKTGFTLIELVIVMAIIAILTAAGLSSYISSQVKGRDARRKGDLTQISRAIEIYYNDHGSYPSAHNGLIVSCGDGTADCSWNGGPFTDANSTIYMQKLPRDPAYSSRQYYYYSDATGSLYALYAWLENTQDNAVITPAVSTDCAVAGGQDCNYGISSPNTNP